MMLPVEAVRLILRARDPELAAIVETADSPIAAVIGWTRTWFAHPLRGDPTRAATDRRKGAVDPVVECFRAFAGNHPLFPMYLAAEVVRNAKAKVLQEWDRLRAEGCPSSNAAAVALNTVFHQDKLPKGPSITVMIGRASECMALLPTNVLLKQLEAVVPGLRDAWPELWACPPNAPFPWVKRGGESKPLVQPKHALDVDELPRNLRAVQEGDTAGRLTADGFGWWGGRPGEGAASMAAEEEGSEATVLGQLAWYSIGMPVLLVLMLFGCIAILLVAAWLVQELGCLGESSLSCKTGEVAGGKAAGACSGVCQWLGNSLEQVVDSLLRAAVVNQVRLQAVSGAVRGFVS